MDFAADDLDLEDDSDSDDSPIVGLPIYDSDGSGGGASDSSDGSEDSGSAGGSEDDFPFSEEEEDAAPPPSEKKKRKGASPFADADAYFREHPEQLDEDGDVEAPVPGELPKKKKKRRTASK
jgi:hypothetical protein